MSTFDQQAFASELDWYADFNRRYARYSLVCTAARWTGWGLLGIVFESMAFEHAARGVAVFAIAALCSPLQFWAITRMSTLNDELEQRTQWLEQQIAAHRGR